MKQRLALHCGVIWLFASACVYSYACLSAVVPKFLARVMSTGLAAPWQKRRMILLCVPWPTAM